MSTSRIAASDALTNISFVLTRFLGTTSVQRINTRTLEPTTCLALKVSETFLGHIILNSGPLMGCQSRQFAVQIAAISTFQCAGLYAGGGSSLFTALSSCSKEDSLIMLPCPLSAFATSLIGNPATSPLVSIAIVGSVPSSFRSIGINAS
jgi:hypothetical protein